MQTYDNVEQFTKAMKAGQLAPPELAIEGMVMPVGDIPTPDNPSGVAAFMFSPGTSCALWIPVPPSVVGKIDHLGTVTCKDHQHEHVRLHLKLPHTPEGPFFAKLLGHYQRAATSAGESVSHALNTMFTGRGNDFAMAPAASPMAFGWHPPHIPLPHPPVPPWFACARCISENLVLAAALGAGVAEISAVAGLAQPAMISWLMTKFGVDAVVAGAAIGGVSDVGLARVLCRGVC